ncbi:mucin-2-like [Anopheles albimanus]|uniref:mucin-2-like n=1 Tax=Anopheles albimanus TaxID=7167 RepID=UPI00164099B8|nr:mucin-2-like [Anopheles albimanus]
MAQGWKFAFFTFLIGLQLIFCGPINRPNAICTEPGSEGLVFPHEYECYMYYLCSSEGVFIMQCLSGYHFSATNLRCEPPQNAQDDIGIPTLPTIPPITEPTIISTDSSESSTIKITTEQKAENAFTFTPPTVPTGTPIIPTVPTGTPLTTEQLTTTTITEDAGETSPSTTETPSPGTTEQPTTTTEDAGETSPSTTETPSPGTTE